MKVKLLENIYGIGKVGEIVDLNELKARALGSSVEILEENSTENSTENFAEKTENRRIKKKK